MKKALVCFCVLLNVGGAQAFVTAKKMTYTKEFALRTNFSALEQVYYNCDSVESEVRDELEQMGAKNVEVECRGGLDTFNPSLTMPAFVTVSYETLRLANAGATDVTSADWKLVNINSFNNCFLMTQVYDQVRDTLEMKDVQAPHSCLDSDSPFRLLFSTLF
jgi:hypothetical protein